MLKRFPTLFLVLASFLCACGSTPPEAPPNSPQELESAVPEPAPELQVEPEQPKLPWEGEGVFTAFSRAGSYLLKWRPVGGPVPKNKHFEIDLWLFKNGAELEPFSGALVATRGWMPNHGHGMVRQPRSMELEGGHYRISGMLLHMGGYWQIFFDVVVDGQAESTQFDLNL